jgi:hypothetical protein
MRWKYSILDTCLFNVPCGKIKIMQGLMGRRKLSFEVTIVDEEGMTIRDLLEAAFRESCSVRWAKWENWRCREACSAGPPERLFGASNLLGTKKADMRISLGRKPAFWPGDE